MKNIAVDTAWRKPKWYHRERRMLPQIMRSMQRSGGHKIVVPNKPRTTDFPSQLHRCYWRKNDYGQLRWWWQA